MAGVFDYYADAVFNTLENQFGEGITFISASSLYPDTISSGIVDDTTPRTDDYGNVVIEENVMVTCRKSPTTDLVEIGDSIRILETGNVYKIINIVLDVNASKVFHLSD